MPLIESLSGFGVLCAAADGGRYALASGKRVEFYEWKSFISLASLALIPTGSLVPAAQREQSRVGYG